LVKVVARVRDLPERVRRTCDHAQMDHIGRTGTSHSPCRVRGRAT
jgi:hypothetical protein